MDRGILCLWSLCCLACSQYLPDLMYTYFTSTHLFWVLRQNREQPQNMAPLLETVQSRSGRQTKNKKANGYLWPPYVGLPDGSVDKESACNAGNTGVVGSIPEPGRSPRVGHGNHSSILSWKIPWTEEACRLQSMRSQRLRYDSTWHYIAYVMKNEAR